MKSALTVKEFRAHCINSQGTCCLDGLCGLSFCCCNLVQLVAWKSI